MKTLTITEAKKNLGKLLKAAARGESVSIISGADVIALRKVEVEEVDDYSYAMQEYGATREELQRFDRAMDEHIAKTTREGKWMTLEEVKERLEKAHPNRTRRLRKTGNARAK